MKFEKGRTPWNKGLKAKDDKRIQRVANMKIITINQLLERYGLKKEDKFEDFCLCNCGQKIIPKKWHFSGKNPKRKITTVAKANT